jgi:tRNA-specific 2-thiouridylase
VNYTEGAAPSFPIGGRAKIRYLHAAAPACFAPAGPGLAEVTFETPQRAMTPGQSLVLYDGDRVAAGGVIESVS